MKDRFKELSFYGHSVKIRIEGFRTDRLIDKAARKGITLRELRLISDTELEAVIAASDFAALKKLARSVYRVSAVGEAGLKARTRAFRKSPLMSLGLLLTALVIIIRALLVSSIIVDGYVAIPEQELRQCLNEAGIYEGAYRPSIEWEKARASLYETFPQISWIKLVYDGSVVYLDIAETDMQALPNEDGQSAERLTYTDLVALKSGYVESVQPLWGETKVEAGDYVKKGQSLITGRIAIEPTTFEEDAAKEYYVRAQGEVWARVPYRLSFAQERYTTKALSEDGEQSDESSESGGEDRGYDILENKRERTNEEIKAKAEQQIRLWAKENLPENAEILNKSLNFTPKENIINIGVTLEVRREISKEQEITVGQEDSDSRGN